MKKYFLLLFSLLAVQYGVAQTNLWKGYFSYNEIKDVTQGSNLFMAASENALFSKNLLTNILKTTNTVDGLSGQTISAVHHSAALNKTMIGYENGLIIIIKPDGSMMNLVDIINKQIPANIKKINHFMEYNGMIYISCDFGIVQYNLATQAFGDTYFIGTGVPEIIVKQTAVFNGYIYAATAANGIKRADVNNPNLIDATQWTEVSAGTWTAVETFGTELMAVNTTGQLLRFNGTTFAGFSALAQPAVDLRASGNYLIATTPSRVYVYNQALSLIVQVFNSQIPDMNAVFTCATVVNETLYMGTLENGVVTAALNNPSVFDYIVVDGPIKNSIFSINAASDNLWVAYGDYQSNYNPDPLRYLGISKYNADGWKNIPYAEVHAPGKEANDLVRITVSPANPELIYVSSYHSGLLKLENDVLTAQYDQLNTGSDGLESLLDPFAPTYKSVRIEQSAFDRAGNLWMTNGLIPEGIKVLRTSGAWQGYNLESIQDDYFEDRIGRMVVDKNDTKWIVTFNNGVIGFNENATAQLKKMTMGSDEGNLPIEDARAIAIDTRNQLWIGTRKGLRVLSSVDRFLSEGQMNTTRIVAQDDEGAPYELMYEQFITDIAVDGANNKWIGTADSGVFFVSANGQETFHIFTINNSPLPSNTINDIEINGKTGEVFIATDKGMVSYKGTSTSSSDDLNNVIVFPNPVRPEFAGTVKITGLVNKANIKITDIEGNLVFETIAEGGTIEWDTTAFGKYRVASGVYMIFISTEDGAETKVKKVMIIR